MTDKQNIMAGLLNALANAGSGGSGSGSGSDESVNGQLPRPTKLAITDNAFFWEWHLADNNVDVVAAYLRNVVEGSPNQWNVTVDFHGLENQSFSLESAKSLGEALLSAYEWQQVWKLFFADYFIQSQTTDSVVRMQDLTDVSLVEFDNFGNEII